VILAAPFEIPPLSAWLYFVFHLFAAATHVISVVLLVAQWFSFMAGVRRSTRIIGMVAHGTASIMHFVFATIGFFNWRIRAPDGTVPWWFVLVMAGVGIGLPTYVFSVQRDLLVLRRRVQDEEERSR
jgi:hypothetical protein